MMFENIGFFKFIKIEIESIFAKYMLQGLSRPTMILFTYYTHFHFAIIIVPFKIAFFPNMNTMLFILIVVRIIQRPIGVIDFFTV